MSTGNECDIGFLFDTWLCEAKDTKQMSVWELTHRNDMQCFPHREFVRLGCGCLGRCRALVGKSVIAAQLFEVK